MTTQIKKKLTTLNKKDCEEQPRSNSTQNSKVLRSQKEYINQLSAENDERVTKKLSQKFSSTEKRILGALGSLDYFLMNPLIQGHSGTTRETSRNILIGSQGTKEDDTQNNSHPEAAIFNNQMTRNSAPEDSRDTVDV